MLTAHLQSSLELLLGNKVGDVSVVHPRQLTSGGQRPAPLDDAGELETSSSQICTAITDQDWAHPVWKQVSPNFRHYTHDNGCFAGFNPNGLPLQAILLARERYTGPPEQFTTYLGSHCVKMQTTVDEKLRSVSMAEIFVFFHAGGMPIGKMGEGVTVFTWVKRRDEWTCVKSATLRHCWSVDYCGPCC